MESINNLTQINVTYFKDYKIIASHVKYTRVIAILLSKLNLALMNKCIHRSAELAIKVALFLDT